MFTPLHVYSGFSFLSSGLPVKRISLLARKNGYSGVGISDLSTCSGFAPFYHSCLSSGVKPYFLMDAYLLEGTFSILVKSEVGYKNLLKIELAAKKENLTLKTLIEHQEGLSFIINPETTFLSRDYSTHEEKDLALRLSEIVKGLDSVYIGIPYLPDNPSFISFLRSFFATYPYKTIAFPFISYEKKEDAIVTSITHAIEEHSTLSIKEKSGDNFFLSQDIVNSYYSEEEIKSEEGMLEEVDFAYIKKRGSLIHYENDEGLSSGEYLRKKALEGLKKKELESKEEYCSRLEYELSVIHEMGYDDYFLVVADYVSFAKNSGILVGPGRGSGPASLVSYLLDISTIDPLENGLLFERFLNKERQSMPDIDVDFADDKRDLLFSYLQKKYGESRVSRVLATQTIGAKEALRDIGRVYEYEEREISLIVSTITNDKLSLRDDYRKSPEFKKLVDSDPYYLQIVALASKIEGLPRQAGLHAAGLILNNEPLSEALPLSYNDEIGYIADLEKDYLEEQGFLKMDLLGLSNLTYIDHMLKRIEKNEGKKLTFEEIPYNDEESIALIKEGKTMGIFQMESEGMRRAIKTLEPTTYEDIVALEALYRPGPMENIPLYARRKKGLEKPTYLDPALEDILKSTYGIIVYQEQIMQITQKVASFTLGEADLFRRAISKKDAKKLSSLKDKFIDGCLKNGRDEATASRLFSLIERFADYGFNKAHAASYSVITCRMAYLKKHYPIEFYSAVLEGMEIGSTKFMNTVAELREMGVKLSPPSINDSTLSYVIKDGSLLLPLSSIKGINIAFLSSLLDERIEKGPFLDLADFALRSKKCGLTLPIFVRLIDAGAFDSFCPSRASMRVSAYRFYNYSEMMGGDDNIALFDLGIEKPEIEKRKDDTLINLEAEYEALGMMVSGSPLAVYAPLLKQKGAIPLEKIKESERYFLTSGVIGSIRVINTRNGKQMCFIDVYDDIYKASFTLFSEAYSSSFKSLKEGNIVLINGHKDYKKDGYMADKVETLGENSNE